MYETQRYDRPPQYSPPSTATSRGLDPAQPSTRGQSGPSQGAAGSMRGGGRPQHFYTLLSPPGMVRVLQGLIAALCFVVFVCVASALVWDMGYNHGPGPGGYGAGAGGYGYGSGAGTGVGYGYSGSYPTPYSGKAAMISAAVLNFLAAVAFLALTFSRPGATRGRGFHLAVLAVDVVMAVLQGAADAVFVVGVNPTAQGSASAIQNPMLRMCRDLDGNNAWEGAGGVGGFPMYTQYLFHYCYMDAQEIVAMVCGFLAVVALAVAAYFSHKTRSKICRHGKANIYWDPPPTGAPGAHDLEGWANRVEGGRSIHDAPTLLMSEKPAFLRQAANSVISYPTTMDSILREGTDPVYSYSERSVSRRTEQPSLGRGVGSTPTGGSEEGPKPLGRRLRRRSLNSEGEETGHTVSGETGGENDLDQWRSLFPEITSDAQRKQYRRQFDSDLALYKRLCAERDDVTDQMSKLSRELDTLPEETARYQAVSEEYLRLKELNRNPEYQTKKLQCRELRQKLFHIKSMVRGYDRGRS